MGKKREEPKPFHKRGLEEDIEDPAAQGVRSKLRAEKKRRRLTEEETDDAIDDKISSRILRVARDQQIELEDEDREEGPLGALSGALKGRAMGGGAGPSGRGNPGGRMNAFGGDQQREDEDEDLGSDLEGYGSDQEYEYEEEEIISAEDEKALRAFMAGADEAPRTKTLADLILEKIREKQRAEGVQELPEEMEGPGEGPVPVPEGLDQKVVEVYQAVGQLMRRYTTGSVPKAFKVIPSLHNWEEILYLTDPEGWSPHAVYQATRLFASNLNQKMSQRFFSLVLLPRFRADIGENRRLHFMLFQALKKALYKAGAFYKGFLLPLCEARDCTLREAVILSSVLKRVSIPVIHSAAALLKMAEMPYCGTTSFFIRVLLDKKYTLPYRVVDALVDHFARFQGERRELPVVWHQALLVFVQRYKSEIRAEDKEALKALTRAQYHHLVSPEIHRELDQSRSRGQRAEGVGALEAKGRVGVHVKEDVRDLAPVVIMEDDL